MTTKSPDQLIIHKATTDDCKLINRLANIIFPETYKDILSPEQTEYMMDWMYSPANLLKQMTQENHTYFIGYLNNEPFGYLSIQPKNKEVYHLQKIYVLPGLQGKGLGKFLFEKAKEYILQTYPDAKAMRLNVNRNNKAKEFYERMGMHVHSEGDFAIGNGYFMNDYIMEIRLQ